MAQWADYVAASLDGERPVLIAGPTASGKSALALAVARRTGGVIVNADALQVFANWRILTARPSPDEEAEVRHRLYGHIPGDTGYSVGHWLRDVIPFLDRARPIIVGGTGLYFAALTDGLAEIPPTPPEVRAEADERMVAEGPGALLAELDADTTARIDRKNPVRIQRAWEVQAATGRGLAAWQDETGAPALPLAGVQPIVLAPPRDLLSDRIALRFRAMLTDGVMDEVAANAPGWSPTLPSAKAIGAAELIAVHRGETTLAQAEETAVTLTRQYAKRQRSWFRSRMQNWHWIDPSS